jgi:hypothetical protein
MCLVTLNLDREMRNCVCSNVSYKKPNNINLNFCRTLLNICKLVGARGSVVVESLCYKLEVAGLIPDDVLELYQVT